jgi:peptidoglycan/LPS O-acetylase OafA/YrhL
LLGWGPQFLGRISFGLYLVHMPLLFTVFAALYLALGRPPGGLLLSLWAVAFLIAAIVAGYGMTRLIDEPWMALRHHFEKRIGGRRGAAPALTS